MPSTLQLVYLCFAAFCAFVGALYQFVNNKNVENYRMSQRMVSLIAATLLMVILEAITILVWGWNWLIVCFLGFLLGIGAEIFLRLLMKYYGESTGLLDFIQRVRLAYKAAKQIDPTQSDEGPIENAKPT